MHASKINRDKISLSMLSKEMREAIASSRLEGLELTDEALYDAYLLDQGEISLKEYKQRAIKRAKS